MIMAIRTGFQENYGRFEKSGREFDVRFWQQAGNEAIFEAARELIIDHLILRQGHAHEPRLQRSVESFQRL